MRGAAGFSLVEAVAVMLILGLAASVALPRYAAATARYRADAAARRVALEIESARAAAVRASRSTTIAFDVAAHRCLLTGFTSVGPSGKATDVIDLRQAPYEAVILGADFEGAAKLTFDGYGTPDAGGLVKVVCGDAVRRIVVDGSTGRVSLP